MEKVKWIIKVWSIKSIINIQGVHNLNLIIFYNIDNPLQDGVEATVLEIQKQLEYSLLHIYSLGLAILMLMGKLFFYIWAHKECPCANIIIFLFKQIYSLSYCSCFSLILVFNASRRVIILEYV